MKYRIVLSTMPDEKTAKIIARKLLSKKVCACVNVIPGISSFYWWKRKIDSSRESLLVIKTTQSKTKRLIASLVKLHPYEVPEIISAEIKEGWTPYLNWISSSVR